MNDKLTEKAEKLYACIKKRGGGAIEEWWLRDQTGLSHGSFCAARKELVAAGLLVLGKDIRKTTYEVRELTGKTGAENALTCQKEERAVLTSQPCDGAALPCQKQHLPETAQAAADKPPAASAAVRSTAISSDPMRQADELSVETVQEAEAKQAPRGGDFFFASPMPHVAGTFFDFDEWTDALMNALGDCLDISESLVEEGTYTVYSHDYESEDTYHTETTADGFIVN